MGKKSLPRDQGSSEKAEVKRKVLREGLNCGRELLCWMWGEKLFQTRGAWTENYRWPSPWVSILYRRDFFLSPELERTVRDGVDTERQDDRYGGRVALKKWKAEVAILKSILSLTGSQWIFLRSGLTCSCLLLLKMTLAAWFWIFGDGTFDQRWCRRAKRCNSPSDWEWKNTSAEQWLSSSGDSE